VAAPVASSAWAILRQGFLTCLFNPKLLVFFLSFIPQFVTPQQRSVVALATLGLVFAVVGYSVMIVYGLIVLRVREAIAAPRVRRWMERVTGTVLVGFGLRLVLERA
jgi:threonine/homoserine/homoserine lactone efflux protein